MSTLPFMLAAFVNPGLFTLGVAGVALPVLIHLFARRRFKRIRWAAMDFLIDAEKRNRRRVRLEELLLMLLRCAAVFLIGVALARPFLSPEGVAAAWAGRARTERVFVIDDSFSMGYESADGVAFDRAKQAVRRLLEVIRRESPDDSATVIRTSAPQTPVESGTFLNDVQTETLLSRIDALAPTQRSMDPAVVVEGVAEVLGGGTDVVSAAVYFISDFQRVDWVERTQDPGGSGGAEAVFDPLMAWAGKDRGLRLVLVNVGGGPASNRAVTELAVRAGQLVVGAQATLGVQVANFTDGPADPLELRVTLGNIPQAGKMTPQLDTRQLTTVELPVELLRAGSDGLRVELPPDGLSLDNARYLAVDVAGAIRVLLVNGEPAIDEFHDEVALLKTALRPEGEVFSGNEIVVVDEAGLDQTNLNGFHAVVLANVFRLSDPGVESLERYVRQGGGVVLFLGDQIDSELYNSTLYREGDGLLPAALGERVRGAARSLTVVDRLHPVLRGLSREGDPLGIGRIPFYEYFASIPFSAEEVPGGVGDAAGGGLSSDTNVAPPRPARVIAAFNDDEQRPAIVERPLGAGRVVLVTTTADKEWHLWPDHPTFLPVMMELVQHVARRGESGTHYIVGSPIALPFDPAVYEPDALVRTPAYPAEQEVNLTAQASEDGRGLALVWPHTEQSGFYQFLLRRREGGEAVRLAAVNVDARESDLAACEETDLRRALGEVPFQYIGGLEELAAGVSEARTEFWRAALIAGFLALMGEQLLAWWWGRKR